MRLSDGHEGEADAVVSFSGREGAGGSANATLSPWLVTRQELDCMADALPFGSGTLDPNNLETRLDFSQKFYLPTAMFTTAEQTFKARTGQTALRIMLGYANAKVTLSETGAAGVVAESVPQDDGNSQFLVAENLRPGTDYIIHYSFSARASDLDGQGALACETFILEMLTFATEDVCKDGVEKSDSGYPLYTTPGQDETTLPIRISKSKKSQTVTVGGSTVVDMLVTLDYSSTIFKPWLTIEGDTFTSDNKADKAAKLQALIAGETSPELVDFSRKDAVVYLFRNIHAGNYKFNIH